jgi:hypothetical protein
MLPKAPALVIALNTSAGERGLQQIRFTGELGHDDARHAERDVPLHRDDWRPGLVALGSCLPPSND